MAKQHASMAITVGLDNNVLVDGLSYTTGGDEEIEKTEEDAKDAQKPQEIKYNEATDHAVLKELEDAEQQAIQTANIISKLKEQVTILSKKETMTEKEAKELEKMNMELKKQMTIFEQRTKRIQELIARSDLFENVGLFKSSLSHKEDILPKVVVCGTTEQQMPKILICDGSKIKSKSDRKKRPSSAKSSRRPDICTCETTDQGTDQDLLEMTQHYQRADLELLGMRQQQLPPQMPFQMMSSMMQPQMAPQMVPQQENTCECHQPRASQRAQQMPMTPQMQMPMTPQMQMQMQMPMQMMPPVPMVQQVNMMQQAPQRTRSPFPPMEGPMDYGEFESPRSTSRPQTQGAKDQPTGMSCGKGRGICPTEIESRLQEYSENTQFL
ncbi:uncharacterized protein, partial [Diabrotica undecimpunctata]|uniref:uncharacterized protein n=1 Tax=Diabrotica undecimpunctata TaxID=50387 RepID=UPI003B63B5C8